MVRGKVISNYSKNVFINCPFDTDYKTLLKPLLFTVIYCGFTPLIASQRADSSENRLAKIIELIERSKFSIHDLSRNTAEKAGQHFRFNMPFELGIDWAFKHFIQKDKQFLVLEDKSYSSQSALSDISGCDKAAHNNLPDQITVETRNWFASGLPLLNLPSGSVIWARYNAFNFELYRTPGFNPTDIDHMPISELMMKMKQWIANT